MTKLNYYWDSCIFIAYLNDERGQHGHFIDHIGQFLEEAAAGKCAIFCSSITIAEIPENSLQRGRFAEFLRDMQGNVTPVDPGPPIMRLASHLRSQRYQKQDGNRQLATPDAIHLATAIALQDHYSVSLSAFHTFDTGKRRGADGGKGLPLIGLETWCDQCANDHTVKSVLDLRRERPTHPTPKMV